jgi:uncharacterized protein
MNILDDHQRSRLAELCGQHRVVRLELFGSAAVGAVEPRDLDFLVTFAPMPPADHARAYFGLREGLERQFDRPIDLVELAPIRNPYFLESIEQNRVLVYAA